jgi:hypothetical protein
VRQLLALCSVSKKVAIFIYKQLKTLKKLFFIFLLSCLVQYSRKFVFIHVCVTLCFPFFPLSITIFYCLFISFRVKFCADQNQNFQFLI